MPRTIVDAIADGVIDREEVVDATGRKAAQVDAGEMVRAVVKERATGDDLVDSVKRAALAVALADMAAHKAAARATLKKELKAFEGKDPRLVPAVRNADLAAAKERRPKEG